MAVHRHVGEVVEQLRGAILPLHLSEKLRRGVDEPGRIGIVAKTLVGDDRLKEGEVRRYAANSEFTQCPVHSRDRFLRRRRPGRDLLE